MSSPLFDHWLKKRQQADVVKSAELAANGLDEKIKVYLLAGRLERCQMLIGWIQNGLTAEEVVLLQEAEFESLCGAVPEGFDDS